MTMVISEQKVKGDFISLHRDPKLIKIVISELTETKVIYISEIEMMWKVNDEFSVKELVSVILHGTIDDARRFLDERKVEYTYFDSEDMLNKLKL